MLLEMQKTLPAGVKDIFGFENTSCLPTMVGDTAPGSKKVLGYRSDHSPRGVAQGHNLSPLISVLALEYVLQKHHSLTGNKSVFYADDGLLYHHSEIDRFLF